MSWEPRHDRVYKDGVLIQHRIQRTPDGPWEDYVPEEPLPEKSKGALSHEENKRHNKKILDKFYEENAHLYTGEWVGLTNEEIDWLWGLAFKAKLENMPRHFARMVEENLKEKNT